MLYQAEREYLGTIRRENIQLKRNHQMHVYISNINHKEKLIFLL